jgi:FtsP/CotA-like multicopper oxidase with cupredoxin domain
MRIWLLRALIGAGVVAGLALAAWVGKAWWDSRLPSTYSAMEFGSTDYGGGPAHDHTGHGAISVDRLHGPRAGKPDYRITLVAQKADVELGRGRTTEAWTFNSKVPGPEIRVRQGDLVEATLVNKDIDEGVTIHWHGVDVPNAEDGVAGVTQDAVMPGERYVYRFRADQLGTFWYHSHQISSQQVRRGLYGAFVIEPRQQPRRRRLDLTVIAHDFSGATVLGSHAGRQRRPVPPGTPVRLRLVNSNSFPERFQQLPRAVPLRRDGVPCSRDRRDGSERTDAHRGQAATAGRRGEVRHHIRHAAVFGRAPSRRHHDGARARQRPG